MALSYEFSIGSVRAKENALFSKTDLEQLLGCKTTAELCQTLSDKGYGTVGAFDEMTKRTWTACGNTCAGSRRTLGCSHRF